MTSVNFDLNQAGNNDTTSQKSLYGVQGTLQRWPPYTKIISEVDSVEFGDITNINAKQ